MLPHTAKLSASFVDLHADGRRWSGIFKMSDRQPGYPTGPCALPPVDVAKRLNDAPGPARAARR